MRITIVQGGSLPVPPLRGGAIEKVWFNLGKEFARRGHKITHISRTFDSLPSDQWLDGVHHVRVKGLELANRRYLVVWKDLLYALRAVRRLPKADVVVTNTPVLPLLLRSRRFGALYVHMGRYPKGQTRYYRHAARIQAVSQAVADAIKRQDPASAPKITVLPYPLPTAVPNLDVAASWSERRKEILYVGRLHPEKGVQELIDAFKLLVQSGVDGWHLRIVGPWAIGQGGGGRDYYESLRTRAASLAGRVELVGPIFDHGVLNTYYRRARLFVYPSLAEHGESFGLAPLEAMAQGCPSLVSNLECFQEYLEDGWSGFVFDHRSGCPVDELYRALKRIVNSDRELRSVAVRSHETALAYDPRNIAGRYLDDFAAVARGCFAQYS